MLFVDWACFVKAVGLLNDPIKSSGCLDFGIELTDRQKNEWLITAGDIWIPWIETLTFLACLLLRSSEVSLLLILLMFYHLFSQFHWNFFSDCGDTGHCYWLLKLSWVNFFLSLISLKIFWHIRATYLLITGLLLSERTVVIHFLTTTYKQFLLHVIMWLQGIYLPLRSCSDHLIVGWTETLSKIPWVLCTVLLFLPPANIHTRLCSLFASGKEILNFYVSFYMKLYFS